MEHTEGKGSKIKKLCKRGIWNPPYDVSSVQTKMQFFQLSKYPAGLNRIEGGKVPTWFPRVAATAAARVPEELGHGRRRPRAADGY